MELTVAIAILAILLTIAVPTYINIKRDAEDAEFKADMVSLKSAFCVSSVVNSSLGKAAVSSGTIINVLSDKNGNVIDPNTVKLYSIDTSISSYYNNLNKSLENYMVDSSNNVYYKGRFSDIIGELSAKLESDIGTSVATNNLSGDVISGRYGHSAVFYNGKMIVFGGYDTAYRNDCYEVDLSTYASTRKTLTGSNISQRGWHSAVVFNDKMIIFGGYNGSDRFGDCYEIDLRTYKVASKTLTGDAIPDRQQHSALVFNGNMIIFGGQGDDTSPRNDCYEVDLETYIVTQKTLTGSAISARRYHSAVLYNGNMIIFGGRAGSNLNDCYSVDLYTYKSTARTITGDAISARYGHTAVVYNGKMIIFAGYDTAHRNDCYAVDLSTYASVTKNLVDAPPARYCHSAVMYNGKMIVFGGLGSDWVTTYNDCKEIY